jgi:preprotein translocase subunit SecF
VSLREVARGESTYDIVGNRRTFFKASWVMVVVSLAALLWPGLDLSIDFTGGVVVSAPNPAGATAGELAASLERAGLSQARVESLDGGAELRVRSEVLDEEEEVALRDVVATVTGAPPSEVVISSVGPTFGAAVTRQAVIALTVFVAIVALFFTVRYEVAMALGSISALLKDLAITFGVYALAGFDVTPATIVAILTTLGYSLYDNVVVYDIIQENTDEADGRVAYADVVNRSINQVLMRSLVTSLTTLVPVGSLLVVGLLLPGAGGLQEFALALFVGILIGTYSSLFLVAPMLVSYREWRGEDTSTPERTGKRTRSSTTERRGFESTRKPGSGPPRRPSRGP